MPLLVRDGAAMKTPDTDPQTGKAIRLTAYAACAG